MWKKGLISVAGLMAAFFGPLLFFKIPAAWNAMRQSWSHASSDVPPPQPTFSDPSIVPTGSGGNGVINVTAARLAETPLPPLPAVSNTTATVTPTQNLGEIFRFDVNPQWIAQRWPRVSIGTPDIQLQGFRVPLVTGTSQTDLAGALTYYFNANYQVQRITFTGYTGDYSPLVNYLLTRYHFARRITGDPSIQIYETVDEDGKSMGTARFRTAPTLKASDQRRRFQVELVIERPKS